MSGPYLLLVGAPGSGKSTWARKFFPRDAIVSSDDLRTRIGGQGNQDATPYAFRALHAIAAGRVRFGLPTVVDATNASAEHREELLSHGYAQAVPPIAVIFDTPLDLCIERNARRPKTRRVPEDYLRVTHAAIAEEFPAAMNWIPGGFGGGLWVRHEQPDVLGGTTMTRHHRDADWLDGARQPTPDWFHGPGKWPYFHSAGWDIKRVNMLDNQPESTEEQIA